MIDKPRIIAGEALIELSISRAQKTLEKIKCKLETRGSELDLKDILDIPGLEQQRKIVLTLKTKLVEVRNAKRKREHGDKFNVDQSGRVF